MPPRNSDTKAFKKYQHNIISENGSRVTFTVQQIYDSILKPEESINNPYNKLFEEYKANARFDGIDIEKKISESFKEGDPRYANSDWYLDKLKD